MKIIKLFFIMQFAIASVSNAQNWKGVGGGMDDGIWCFYTDTFRHVLYAGGAFQHAGGVLGYHISKWDGLNWTGMPSGLPDVVISIAADSNYVYAPVGDIVYKYNGIFWIPLPDLSAQVKKVAIVNGELYAGGNFLYQGTNALNHIAKWNGANWDSLGPGVGEFPNASVVNAITEYQGNLVVGGHFSLAGADTMNNLAMWDGSSWHSIGNGVFKIGGSGNSAVVYDLFADGNNLYVAGYFEWAGAFGGLTVNSIAMWDGTSWHNFGNGAFRNSSLQNVLGLMKRSNELYAIGGFSAGNLVKWDGINWYSYFDGEFNSGVGCMALYNNEFYVGDVSLTDTNGQVLNYVARRATFDLANDTVACMSNCNGAATAEVLGVLPNTYLWSNGATTQSVTDLCAGINSVTVTDSAGSISTATVTVISPSAIIINSDSTNASCASCNNGIATITVSGGSPPYNYLWSNGDTTSSIDSLLHGVYTVTVTDVNGCIIVNSVTVGFDLGISQLIVSSEQLTIGTVNQNSIEINIHNSKSTNAELIIYNMQGQLIKQMSVTLRAGENHFIEPTLFAQGMYLLQLLPDSNQDVYLSTRFIVY